MGKYCKLKSDLEENLEGNAETGDAAPKDEHGDKEGSVENEEENADIQGGGDADNVKPRTPTTVIKWTGKDNYGLPITKGDTIRVPPCYLPNENNEKASTSGPPSKIDWSPMAALTNTRPIVDRYSVARYSPNEWRARNAAIVKNTHRVLEAAYRNQYSCDSTFLRTSALVEKTQRETTENLQKRVETIEKYKRSFEVAIKAMADEITTFEVNLVRLKKCSVVLKIPESIARECLELRCGRMDTELVRDQVDEELLNEIAIIEDLRHVFKKTLEDFIAQQASNRAARQRLEYNWSDKKDAVEIENINISLNNHSRIIMFRPGAVREPPEQSSEENWLFSCRRTLDQCEGCRAESIQLRQSLNSTLNNAARDLRNQADIVERAFRSRINCTTENLRKFENDLVDVLKRLATTESRIERLYVAVRSYDAAMKVAQSRMDNRNYRPNEENCRDRAQRSLIDEVHTIQSGVSTNLEELQVAQRVKDELMEARNVLEHEIMMKRRTLMLDRDRCMTLRSHFPTSSALTG